MLEKGQKRRVILLSAMLFFLVVGTAVSNAYDSVLSSSEKNVLLLNEVEIPLDRSGREVRMDKGDKAIITYDDGRYDVIIDKIENDHVTMTVNGKETRDIRENENGVFGIAGESSGLMASIIAVIGNSANIRFRKVENVLPVEEKPVPQERPMEGITGYVIEETPQQAQAAGISRQGIILYGAGIVLILAILLLIRHFAGKRRDKAFL